MMQVPKARQDLFCRARTLLALPKLPMRVLKVTVLGNVLWPVCVNRGSPMDRAVAASRVHIRPSHSYRRK